MSVASLEAELSRQKAINRELRQELSEIEASANNSYQMLESCNREICNTLDASTEKFVDSHQKGIAAIELQGEIDKMYVRFKQMELANKKIRECNNKKYYDFANYRTIRKLVQGMMDNLDVNLISDAVIYKSVEAQHLKTPDYWLTCVLLAIMAWKNDDRALAERAIERAIALDKKNSAIFFMLFNLRMQRDEAALKWFFTYQECPLKGSDQRNFLLLFALVSKSVNESENVSAETRGEIQTFIKKVVQANIEAQGYSQGEMVSRAQAFYNRMDGREEPAYPLLKKHCKDFSGLATAMRMAAGNLVILEFLKKLIHVEPGQRNQFVKNYIDELVAQANSEEKSVYDEIRYNELIIRYQGEVNLAKEKFDAEQKHDESQFCLIAEMIDWVFTGSEEEVNGQSRLNMFTLTKEIHEKAVENHTEAYRAIEKNHLEISVGEYEATADFSNQAEEEKKVEQFYCARRDTSLSQIKSWPAYVGFGVAVLAAVASPFVNLALLIITVIGAGFGVITLLTNKSARKRIMLDCQNNIASTSDIIRRLFQEHKAYLEELCEYDRYVEQISAEFLQI